MNDSGSPRSSGHIAWRQRPRARHLLLVALVALSVLAALMAFRVARDAGGRAAPRELSPAAAVEVPSEPPSPVAVAAAISAQAFADQATVQNVLLAKASPSAEALAASGLQGLFSAPLLLTDPDELSPETATEINRFGRPAIHLLGGTEAVSPAIEDALAAAGHAVHRHAGPTGIETAIDIAERHFGAAEEAVLASTGDPGSTVAEVLAEGIPAGALAAAREVPVLMTAPGALTPTTAQYLERSAVQRVLVVGDTSTISERVLRDLQGLGLMAERIGRGDRFGTAVEVALNATFAPSQPASVIALVEGDHGGAWPASFLMAVSAERFGGAPVVLADGDGLPDVTASFLTSRASASTFLLCSPGVSEAACTTARELVAGG